MIRNERDDIQFRISRRRLFQGLIASVGISCSSPDLKIPILRSEEDEHTDIAKRFLEVLFFIDIEKVRSAKTQADYLNAIGELYSLFHPHTQGLISHKSVFLDYFERYYFCKGIGFRKIGYSEVTSGYREDPRNFFIDKEVTFEFERPCTGTVEGRQITRSTIDVTLRKTTDGKYAPINFQ